MSTSFECAKVFDMAVYFQKHLCQRATHNSAPISSEVEMSDLLYMATKVGFVKFTFIKLHRKLLPQSTIVSGVSTLEYSSVKYDWQKKQDIKVR